MSNDLTKVLIEIPKTDWHSISTETLWAKALGDNLFRLENSPFYAKGYSFLDTVWADFDPQRGFPVVRKTIQRSGHSTYALYVSSGVESNNAFSSHWEPLGEIGCSFEGADNKLLSVDVPAKTNIFEAYRLMQAGEDAGAWGFQEQDVGHNI